MELNPLKIPISTMAGIAGVLIFLALLIAAMARFPDGFSPLTNWISDLGNTSLNPDGASYFNAACLITGVLMLFYYLGFYLWYTRELWRNALVILGQLAGALSGIALILVGIYPEIYASPHYLWSFVYFLSSLGALILINAGLFTHLLYDNITAYCGLAAIAVTLVFVAGQVLGIEQPVFEWLSVGLALLWATFAALNTYKRFT